MLEAPIFIVGAGRSGTTLLRTALAAHPRLAVTPETHYMKFADGRGARDGDRPADFEAFWATLTRWSRFLDLDVSEARVLEMASASGAPTFRSVFAAMLAAYGEANGKPRVGEKSPGHYRYWKRLFAWFPDSRLVAIRRDPRAAAASALATPWVREQMKPKARLAPVVRRSRSYHLAEQARGWHRIYGEYVPEAEQDPRVLVVTYEDLVTEPEAVLRSVCRHIGEEFDAAMLTRRAEVPGARASAAKTGEWEGWVAEHEAQAAREISDAGLRRWREVLTPTEIAMVEAICGETMTRCRYRLESTARRLRLGGRIAKILVGADQFESRARELVRR